MANVHQSYLQKDNFFLRLKSIARKAPITERLPHTAAPSSVFYFVGRSLRRGTRSRASRRLVEGAMAATVFHPTNPIT